MYVHASLMREGAGANERLIVAKVHIGNLVDVARQLGEVIDSLAVQDGDVTLEELQVAAALRDLKAGELLSAPEVLKLRETIWGAAR